MLGGTGSSKDRAKTLGKRVFGGNRLILCLRQRVFETIGLF